MRIIAGEFRSRKLKSVPGKDVRPTPDRLRESLFSVLAPHIAGCTFMDAYAGSGAVGLEALSRGASRVYLVERDVVALRVIQENVAALKAADQVRIIHDRATRQIPNYPVDILFIDPPYKLLKEYEESLTLASESTCRLAVAQHASRLELKERYLSLMRTRVLRQGDNSLSFYSLEASDKNLE